MVLNPEYVRDVLLAIESFSLNERITMTALGEKLPDIAEDDLWYTCIKLAEAGFLNMDAIPGQPLPGIKQIHCMTYLGHEFLAKIRDEGQWGVVQKGLNAVRNYSLSAVAALAEGATSAAISAYFGR